MKTRLLIFLFLSVFGQTSAQNAYYDAVELSKCIDPSTNEFYAHKDAIESVAKILKPYIASSTTGLKADQILAKLNLKASPDYNPILQKYINTGSLSALGFANSVDAISRGKLSMKSLANADVTMYADALAQFMIERAQAELTVAFFDRFKKFVEDHPEVKTLFPKTCERMENLLSVNYRQMLNVLRDAFQEDLEELPEHLLDVVDGFAVEYNMQEVKLAVRMLKQVKKLEYMSASEFLNRLPEITSDCKASSPMWYQNLNASFELTALVSNSIRATSDDENWVNADSLKQHLLLDEITRDLYLGLVYQSILLKKITFNSTPLASQIRADSAEAEWYSGQLDEFIEMVEEIEGAVSQMKAMKAQGETLTNPQIHSYISTTLESIEFGYEFYEHYAGGSNDFGKYLSMANSANEIYKYVYEKQYGSAIMETVTLLDEVYGGETKLLKDLTRATKKRKFGDNYQLSAATLSFAPGSDLTKEKSFEQVLDDFNAANDLRGKSLEQVADLFKVYVNKMILDKDSSNQWIGQIAKYGLFMSNMVNAETAEEAKAIIESVALPVGSSSLRKNSTVSMNVTSYLGASFATANNWQTAISAPIGVDFGVGFKRGGSVSLNASILDIGAIVDYRLSSDSSEIVSKISLGNIFSPGVSLVYGFPYNIPLALGAGYQYGPGLGGINTNGEAVINDPTWQFKVFLAVDMPLLNIMNRRKKFLD